MRKVLLHRKQTDDPAASDGDTRGNHLYYRPVSSILRRLLFAFLVTLPCLASAQTINTTVGSTGYTGGNGAGANFAITFVIENTSGAAILLTDVKNFYPAGNSGAVTLYYSTTSLSGAYGTLTTPNWTVVATGTQTAPTAGIQSITWAGGLSFLIPNGAQYRFALLSASYCSYSGSGTGTSGCSPSTFTNSGVTLKVGDVQIGGSYVGYGATNNPRWFTGEITFMPATPCSGPPNAGTTTATPATPCYGAPALLTLSGATLATGLSYSWESNPGTGWVPIAGATSNSYTVPSVTGNTQYRAWVKCGNDSSVSSTLTLNTTPLPGAYTETFESITADNQLPGCMTSTNLTTNTRTYIANQTNATNHTPGGSKFGAFYYSPAGTNAFFTPAVQLTAGTTYLFRFWYRGTTNGNSYNTFGAYYGTTNTIAGMTNLIGSASPTSTTYQEFAESFTPTVSGVYYIGIMGTHTATLGNTYVSIDDLGLNALTPCTGKPAPGTINPIPTPCPNQPFTLTVNGSTSSTVFGNLTFLWEDSSALTSGQWLPSVGNSTSPSLNVAGGINVVTKYRRRITCNNSNQVDVTPVYTVTPAPFINCFCIPTYATGASANTITNVKLTTLNNTSTGSSPWYADYSSQQPGSIVIPDITMLKTDTLSVSHSTNATNYSGVWIDFNHNGIFDVTEFFTQGTNVGASGIARIAITPPITALPGITRMRIRAGDRAVVTATMPCGATGSAYGEAEDYLVNILFPVCSGPTNAGVAKASDTGICVGYTVNVWDTTHEYQRSQLTWSWEKSIDNGFSWSAIANSRNKDTLNNLLITGAVQYRLKMVCDATGDSTYSVPVNIRIKPPYACYCYSQSSGTSMDTSDIGSVTIHNMTNTTGGPHLLNPVAIRRRTDYTDIPNIVMAADSTYRLSIFHTQPNGLHADALVTVFIDYNNDLVYDVNAQPDGERVFSGYTTAGNYYLDAMIHIPNAVIPNVPTGLRVIINNDRNPSSPANLGCGEYVSGETEDYVVMFKRGAVNVKGVNGLEHVSLYPNPTTGKFTVNVGAQSNMSTLDISISSVTGQRILHKAYSGVGNKFKQDLDLSEVAKGVYFVEAKTASGDKMIQKLVIR